MSITTLSALPTAPNRTDSSSVFVTRADAWVAALETFTTEFNSNVADLNQVGTDAANAAASAAVALAAANFKGNWSTLSGAAAIPYSVRGADEKYYMLIAAMADVTTHEPGVTSGWETYWAEITVGGGAVGRTTVAAASNTELTGGNLIYDVSASADGVVISLFSASANMTAGSLVAIVINAGDKAFDLVDNGGGNYYANLYPGEAMFFYCRTAADAEGTYYAYKQNINVEFSGLTLFESAQTDYGRNCRIAENKSLVVYRDSGNGGYFTGCVLQLDSNGVLEAGTPQVIENHDIDMTCVIPTDADNEAMAACVGTDNNLDVFRLSISGTVITIEDEQLGGATGVQGGSAVYSIDMCMLTASLFAVVYLNGSSYPEARAFTVSGHTMSTLGGSQVGASSTSRVPTCFRVSDTTFAMCWNQGSSAYSFKTELMSISGTTISAGAEDTMLTGLAGPAEACILDNGIMVAAGNDNYSSSLAYLDITTATTDGGDIQQVGNCRIQSIAASLTTYPKVCPLTRNSAMIFEADSNTNFMFITVIVVADDGQFKVVYSENIYGPWGDALIPNYIYTDINYMGDGRVLLTARFPNDYSNYGYGTIITVPELVQ